MLFFYTMKTFISAYFDQELLRRVESQGVPVHVTESAGNTVTLKIISANR
jgi:hypothetical protein